MNKLIICSLIIILMFRQIIYANSDNNTYINSSNIKYDEKNNIVEVSLIIIKTSFKFLEIFIYIKNSIY